MPTNKISICSTALVLVGAEPISGFAQSSTEEIVAERLYQSTLENLLSLYRWRFACQHVQLTRLEETPDAWDAQYTIPAGATMIHGVYISDERIDFDRIGARIMCNATVEDEVIALLGFIPDEVAFPPYFVSTLELKLAASFAIPIADDMNKAQAFDQMFQRQFAMARTMESQGRTPAKISLGGLRRYHGGTA